jgi:hypothetical protein
MTKKDLLEAIEDMPMDSLIEIEMPNINFPWGETIATSAKEVKCGKFIITISSC